MPEISLILPVYNSQSFLDATIESIVNQEFERFEVILVDDGSSDRSGVICDRIANIDKRFRVFHQENAGASAARNRGILESRGRWIIFMDSDDIIGYDYLSKLYENCCVNGVTVAGFYERNGDKTIISVDFGIEYFNRADKSFIKLMSDHKLLNHPSPIAKIFDGDLIRKKQIKFNGNISICEDLIFWMEFLVHADHVKLISPVNYFYLKDNSNLTKRKHSYKCHIELAEEFIRLNALFSDRISNQPSNESLRHEAILLMNAIMSLYHSSVKRRDRIKILHGLKDRHGNRIKNYYKASTNYMAIKKWLFLNSLPIFDLMNTLK